VKNVRKAVRCYLIKDGKVVVTKYNEGQPTAGYYDIPGGKIEDGETAEQAAIREMEEETGIVVKNLKHRGRFIADNPNKIFDFEVFLTADFEGEPQDFAENTSEWIEIEELLKKEKIFSNIMLLDKFFINGLIDEKYCFEMYVRLDDDGKILEVKYNLEEK